MTTSPGIRASDADREQVVEILRAQTAQGRLTLEELQERTGAAYTARTWHELRRLTSDLPVEPVFERDDRSRLPAGEERPLERPSGQRVPTRQPAPRVVLAGCCGWILTWPRP